MYIFVRSYIYLCIRGIIYIRGGYQCAIRALFLLSRPLSLSFNRLSYRHRRPIVTLVLVALSLDPDLFPLTLFSLSLSLSRLSVDFSFRYLSSKRRDPFEVDRYEEDEAGRASFNTIVFASSFFPLKRLDASAANNRDASSRKLAGLAGIAHFIATATGRPEAGGRRGCRRHVPAGGASFRVCCSVAGSRESSSGTFAPPWRDVITRPLIDDTPPFLIVCTPLACLHRVVRRCLLYGSSPIPAISERCFSASDSAILITIIDLERKREGRMVVSWPRFRRDLRSTHARLAWWVALEAARFP